MSSLASNCNNLQCRALCDVRVVCGEYLQPSPRIWTCCLSYFFWTPSQAAFTIDAVSREFHVGKEVAILGISIYVMGLGTGPLFSGPLSEVYGRNIVYRVSFVLFFAFSFPVAFAPDIGMTARTSTGPSAGH